MGQFLPEIREVFSLIEVHKRDLEKAIRSVHDKDAERIRKARKGKKKSRHA